MFETLFRMKSVEYRGLPGRPKVAIPIFFGPVVSREKRAQNLCNLQRQDYPNMEHGIQTIKAPEGLIEKED